MKNKFYLLFSGLKNYTWKKQTHTTEFRNNFPRFDFWGDFILNEFQNQFYACSAQPGQKHELGSLFNTNMPAALRVGDCVLVRDRDNMY